MNYSVICECLFTGRLQQLYPMPHINYYKQQEERIYCKLLSGSAASCFDDLSKKTA